jgi:DNA primase
LVGGCIGFVVAPAASSKGQAMSRGVDFEAIREANPIEVFCQSRGIELRRKAGLLVAVCPFHEERSPSFTVFPDGHYHCYGCPAHGRDVIDLCVALDGVSIGDAVRKLSGVKIDPTTSVRPPQRIKVEPYNLSDAEISRMAEAAQRLAADEQKIRDLCEARPEWTCQALRGVALDGDLGIEDGRILFGYRHGIKARWKDANGERVIRWLCGGAGGQCWRQSLLRKEHQRVFLGEGETDVLSGISLGLEKDGESLVLGLAGAGTLPGPEVFQDKEVVIIADPDEAGWQSAQKLQTLLNPFARTIVILDLKEL